MRILFLANHFNTGGITSYLLTLARGLVAQGHEVVVASAGGDRVADLEAAGIFHVFVPLRVKCECHPQIFLSLPALLRVMASRRIDVIHVHTRTTQIAGAILSCLTRRPVVTTCHGFFKRRLGRRLFPLWGRRVIAISPQVARHLEQDFHLSMQEIRSVSNGIEMDRFRPLAHQDKISRRKDKGIPDGDVLGIIARLSDVKGHRYLVEAMRDVLKQHPRAVCLIVGRGPEEDRLRRQVKELGLEGHVFFWDTVHSTPEILPILDIFVLPSVQEGLGLSALEAGACGVPVVASRVGGIPDVIVDQKTGLLVPSRDPKALAEAILLLLKDPQKRAIMGEEARQVVSERFSAQRMVKETLDVYREVVS